MLFTSLDKQLKNDRALNQRCALVGIIAVVVVIALCVVYIKYLSDFFTERTQRALSHTAQNITWSFDSKIKDTFKILQAMSMFIGEYSSLSDPAVLRVLDVYSQQHNLAGLAVTTTAGVSFTTAGVTHESGDREYFVRGLRGESSFTGVYASRVTGESTLVIAVPVYHAGKVEGVLRATYNTTMFAALFRSLTEDERIGCYLVRPDGSILVNAGFLNAANLLAEVTTRNRISKEAMSALSKELAAGRNALFSYESDSGERFVFFERTAGGNYMVVSIPASYDQASFFEVLANTSLLIFSLVLLLGGGTVHLLVFRQGAYEKMQALKNRMETLVANIPGGVLQCTDTAPFAISFCSEGFRALVGYNAKEMRDRCGDYLSMIHESERSLVEAERKRCVLAGIAVNTEYRICRKDSTWCWVSERCQKVMENGKNSLYCVIVDINEQKLTARQNLFEIERHKVLIEVSGGILFELDIHTGFITYSRKFEEKFGLPAVMERFPQSALEMHFIFPDDVPDFLGMFEKIYDGYTTAETEVRLLDRQGRFIWCQLMVITLFDENNVCLKAIGKITDIDAQKSSLMELSQQAQRDPFTQLFNKMAIQNMVTTYIKEAQPGQTGAFFIVDTDNFKTVNDRLGHPTGDGALKDLATELETLFQHDIVGRIGGDEFVVFLKGECSKARCSAKAEEICSAFRRTYYNGPEQCTVSASVGISFFPEHAISYVSLYKKADEALYHSKERGKDCYTFYQESHSSALFGAQTLR